MHSKQLDNNMIDSLRLALEDFNRTWSPAS
jgi:hypothetical protein